MAEVLVHPGTQVEGGIYAARSKELRGAQRSVEKRVRRNVLTRPGDPRLLAVAEDHAEPITVLLARSVRARSRRPSGGQDDTIDLRLRRSLASRTRCDVQPHRIAVSQGDVRNGPSGVDRAGIPAAIDPTAHTRLSWDSV